ncbi:MAG: four helix bundle protein [Acidobacteria bacterium]|nr:four helix bundle protein [Acidobacteriota bacterium]
MGIGLSNIGISGHRHRGSGASRIGTSDHRVPAVELRVAGFAIGAGVTLALRWTAPWHETCPHYGMTHSELCQRHEGVCGGDRAARHLARHRTAAQERRRAVDESVAANHRAAGLARFRREFVAKLGVVIEEADECTFWLEYIQDLHTPRALPGIASLMDESRQLVRIFTASRNTAKARC